MIDIGRVFITGDTHRVFSRVTSLCHNMNTTKRDILIILGDAGINYFLDYRDDSLKRGLSLLPITLVCIRGNHEARPEDMYICKDGMSELSSKEWCEDTVLFQEKYPSILYTVDGGTYNILGNKCIAVGGAYSIDKQYRLDNGYAWFENEQLSKEERDTILDETFNQKAKWETDYILTHTSPMKYEPVDSFLPNTDQSTVDKSMEMWHDTIEDKLEYKKWYCGHYHINRSVDKIRFLFTDIIELGE